MVPFLSITIDPTAEESAANVHNNLALLSIADTFPLSDPI